MGTECKRKKKVIGKTAEEPEGYRPWAHKESDVTEQLMHTHGF